MDKVSKARETWATASARSMFDTNREWQDAQHEAEYNADQTGEEKGFERDTDEWYLVFALSYEDAVRGIERSIRKAETNPKADFMEPHRTFNDYASDDTTAFPCRCYNAGSENWAVNSSDVLHPDEYLKGVDARYQRENNV